MKAMNTGCILIFLSTLATVLHGGTRSSTGYSIPAESADSAGKRTTSTSYTSDGSLGGITGMAIVAAPAETAKSGYIGQLYEVTALQLAASPTTMNESDTRQLSASQLLDDGFLNAVPAASLIWTVQSGPLTSLSAAGLATAGVVGQDTAAVVQGRYLGLSGTLGLTVLDTIADNFGTYAADGLPDTWQLQYFGPNNPLAAPTADATGTGQNNLFKYIAGLNPTDHSSRFVTTVGPASGSHTITISPLLADRSYTVLFSTNLTDWLPLTSMTIQDNGQTRTVTDPDATATKKFYRVEITKP